jgi:site-specific recombinase XerD
MSIDLLPALKIAPRRPTAALDIALRLFLNAKESERVSARTLGNYRQFLQPFLDWLSGQGITSAGEITADLIRSYIVSVQRRPGKKGAAQMSAESVYTHAKHIKTFVRFLFLEEVIPTDPFARVKMPKLPDEVLPAFSENDIKKLLKVCSLRERALVLLLLDTGCRAAELCKLTLADVDTASGEVTIKQGKGKKDRTAFVGAHARKALLKYLLTRPDAAANEALFPGLTTHKSLTSGGLLHLLGRIGQRAGVANCHPHTFRRTFCTWALDNGMDVFALQKIMGHSSLRTMRRYLDRRKGQLHKEHQEHGPVDALL